MYLSDHHLGKSCSFGYPYVLFVLCLFVIFAVSDFGLEGETVVRIEPVSGHCILLFSILNLIFPFSELTSYFKT